MSVSNAPRRAVPARVSIARQVHEVEGPCEPAVTLNRFTSRVLPGFALVRASVRPISALMSVDLPTFDRPTSAISGRPVVREPPPGRRRS